MEAYFLYLKAGHLIFAMIWFFGLFSVGQLSVWHIEAWKKPSPEKEILAEKYKSLSEKLWKNFAWPAMILTFVFGIWIVSYRSYHLSDSWMQIKLILIFLLILLHLQYNKIFKKLQADEVDYTADGMRLFNVFPMILFIALIFISVLRHGVNWIFATLIFFAFILLILFVMKYYKKRVRGF